MTKSPRLLVLLALPLAALLVGLSLLLDPGTVEQPVGIGSEPPSSGVQGEPQSPGVDLVGEAPEEGPVGAPVREAVEEAALEVAGDSAAPRPRLPRSRVPRDAHWVEGTVLFPDGTPAGEAIQVVAGGRRFKTVRGQPDEFAAPIDRDGRFRVAFANGTRKGRLWVDAQYAFMDRPVVVDPTSEEETADLVLEPALGGRIEVEVVPPRAALGNLEFYEDVSVELRGANRWGGGGAKAGRRIDDNRFEVGGINPSRNYLAEARHPEFANGETQGFNVEAGQTTQVVVEFDLGATLEGEVLNSEGERVPQAKVLAMTVEQANQRNPFVNEQVDEESEEGDGSFKLEGVPAGEMVLVVEADGYLEARYELGLVRNGEVRQGLRITLDRGNLIGGVVQWPDGTPAAGALVRISQKGGLMGFGVDIERIMGEVKVPSDGRFLFSALEDGNCQIQASCYERGYEPPEDASLRERLLDPPPLWRAVAGDVRPGQLNLVLDLSEGSEVAGRVVDEVGEPVRSFQIIARPAENDILNTGARKPVKDRFRTKDGRFVLEGVPVGRWILSARALGYGDGDEVPVLAPTDGEIEITLPRECRLSGRIEDPNGEPVDGARLTAEHGGGKTARAQASADGTFSLARLNPGVVKITAQGGGWAKSNPVEVMLSAGEQREDQVIRLRRGAELTVRVDPSSTPIAGRTVRLSGMGWNGRDTDEKGEVVFSGLEPGNYTVTLDPGSQQGGFGRDQWMMNWANQESMEITLADQQRLTITLGSPYPDSVIVRGTVSAGGEPVVGATISIIKPGENSGRPLGAAKTDASGRYEINVKEPSTYTFMVGRDFASQSPFEVEVPAGATFTKNFELPTSSLTGVVRGPSGEAVAKANLELTLVTEGKEVRGRATGRRRATSREDGSYAFEELAPGTYNLRANDSRRGAQRGGSVLIEGVVVEEGGTVLDIDLPLAGTLRGRVEDASGQGLARMNLRLTNEEGVPLSSFGRNFTGPGGTFSIEGLPPGDLWVSASGNGKMSQSVRVEVIGGGESEVTIVAE